MSPAGDFVVALQAFPAMPAVFNPWRDIDPAYDLGPTSPVIRARQLEQYLTERIGKARILLIAEALGYQGGHFSGIAMTSERILLGNLATKGIDATDVIVGGGSRTSSVTKRTPAAGANEPTATVVWGALKAAGIDTREVVLWNSFAAHPMRGPSEWLTNRKPTAAELLAGHHLLGHLISLFPRARTVAVGDVAKKILKDLGISTAAHVRHPAYGGATAFRTGILNMLAADSAPA